MPRMLSLLASLLIATAPLGAAPAFAVQALIDAPRGDTVTMRSGPAEVFEPVRLLRPGASVEVLGRDPANMWARVRDASGKEGWVPVSSLGNRSETVTPLQSDADQPGNRPGNRPDWINRDASGSDGYGTQPDHSREQLYVNSSTGALNLRQGPGTDTPVLDTLRHGSAVTILGGGDPWRRVRAESGQVGYVHGGYLSAVAPVVPDSQMPEPSGRHLGTLYVDAPTYGALNLRQGPGTDFAIAGSMAHGSRIEVLEGGTDVWRFVRAEDGSVGFAHASFLSPTRPRTLPVTRSAREGGREEYRNGRRVIRVSPQELPGLLAACAFSGNLDRCMVRQLERRDSR